MGTFRANYSYVHAEQFDGTEESLQRILKMPISDSITHYDTTVDNAKIVIEGPYMTAEVGVSDYIICETADVFRVLSWTEFEILYRPDIHQNV